MVTTCLITYKFKQQRCMTVVSLFIFLHKEYEINVQQNVASACRRNYLEISIKLYTAVSTKFTSGSNI
jgi:hypothetical protein